jgi:hypothetical protein
MRYWGMLSVPPTLGFATSIAATQLNALEISESNRRWDWIRTLLPYRVVILFFQPHGLLESLFHKSDEMARILFEISPSTPSLVEGTHAESTAAQFDAKNFYGHQILLFL